MHKNVAESTVFFLQLYLSISGNKYCHSWT